MPDVDRIRQKVEISVNRGNLLASMIAVAHSSSAGVQEEYVGSLSTIVGGLRKILVENDRIRQVEYAPKTFWKSVRGKSYAFVDGGVAGIDVPGVAPIGVRVASYTVCPGTIGPDREQFAPEVLLIDDLFDVAATNFDEPDEDMDELARVQDGARIVSEAAAALRIAARPETPEVIVLHGPLVNPAAPYGGRGFPPFSKKCCTERFGLPESVVAKPSERAFIPVYLEILKRSSQSGIPVLGVVERATASSASFVDAVLNECAPGKAQQIARKLATYRLNDTQVLDLVLESGEFVVPHEINRQGSSGKWPSDWFSKIEKIPKPFVTFLKPTDDVLPFRVEGFAGGDSMVGHMELILHTARLLPSYGFPVGLDIVDRFAKVPAWMSRGVRGQHSVVLLKHALANGDPKVIAHAKRVLTARGRDWFLRPGT